MVAAEAAPRSKAKEQLGSERVQNPHDPAATYASKGHGRNRFSADVDATDLPPVPLP